MTDTSVKQQIVDKLKDSSNILVTVNTNPTVDELSAALGITLLINKLNKHATSVFSGDIPPAIEFLNPEKTFENTVDSLRDFIIALDKEKADHLRYKVDGDMVKIFITPYRTTISQDDLDFSQGDYNVEAVLAIGVKSEEDLDRALVAHGRILHDATVASISLDSDSNLGEIQWTDATASSYSEMLMSLAELFKSDKNLIDEQIATAFLTGIVAATDRFSNSKTTSKVMTMAAKLMAAGANQQLIATKLQEGSVLTPAPELSDKHYGDLVEGERTKVNREEDKEATNEPGAMGALSISHVPEGTIDEVAEQVAANNQQEAARAAEDKLAEQLRASSTGSVLPTVAELQKDIAKENEALNQPLPEPAPLRGPVSTDQWRAKTNDDMAEPSMGGTLNATTEQAADDKRREIADDRNRLLLSHDGSAYITDTPAFQAPLNSVANGPTPEPEVKDIFAEQTDTTMHAGAIQPPAPVTPPAPTLAEIDKQNRAVHEDALGAVHAAFDAPEPMLASMPISDPYAPGGLPPLPPMPDFSTLPPLPGSQATPPPMTVPDSLGAILPPASPLPNRPETPNDPSQFRIPGQ